MKKTKKLVGLVTLLFAAGSIMVACGGNNEGDKSENTPESSVHKHKYVEDKEASVAATCTSEGKKVTKCECGDVKETKISKAQHTWVDVAEGSTEATCTEAGVQKQKCSVCGETQDVPVEALGHNYGEAVVTKAATCEEAGEGTQTCSRCGDVIAANPAALGHDIQLIGDDTEPEDGMAKVRVYSCSHDCGQTYLGFKANEVTAASKEHLTIGEDGGASFWGRPIGNAIELDETGSASEANHVAKYDRSVEGDYFEYKFNLTAAQAESLKSCKLYCDAKPSAYMGQNGVDFWKVKGDAASDWTYGMYIDDAPEHNQEVELEDGTKVTQGKIIEDFRYVLYVDGQIKQMDYSVDTRVARGDPRGEYVLPYTFNLHEGVNSIKLVMAGGYRSTFYNFTFRAVEEAPSEDAKTAIDYMAADLVEGQKAPVASDKNTRLGKNIFDDVWNIEGIAAGKYEVYLNAQASAGNASKGYWNSATAVANGDSESNNGGAELSKLYKYTVKVDDGAAVNLGASEDTYAAAGLTESEGNWTTKALATIDIAAGAKTITVHNNNNGYSIWVYGLRLVKIA